MKKVDPFRSPKQRVGRAKQHIRDLNGRIAKFFKRNPHRRVEETDADGISTVHKCKLVKRIPPQFSTLTVEILEGLRSALDQVGYVCATLGGATNPKNTHFPIADSAAQLETDVIGRGRCKDIPPDILTFFRGFKPYKGGHNFIWALNKGCNVAKHQSLVEIGVSLFQVTSRGGFVAGPAQISHPSALRWDSRKNEMILGKVRPGGQFKYDYDFTFFIAFSEIDIISGEPVIPVLRYMVQEVERIITGTEAEARRIGLIA
jgi:hypothetical protein